MKNIDNNLVELNQHELQSINGGFPIAICVLALGLIIGIALGMSK